MHQVVMACCRRPTTDQVGARLERHAAGVRIRYLGFDEIQRGLRSGRFEIGEMSLATLLSLLDQGATDLVALPIFPLRHFRQDLLRVRRRGRVQHPRDLAGARIGAERYWSTALLHLRGLLHRQFGFQADTAEWYLAGEDRVADDGAAHRVARRAPDDLRAMFDDGRIDVLATFAAAGGDDVRHLLGPVKEAERTVWSTVGCVPVMHVLVCRRTVLEDRPGVDQLLLDAFEGARRDALRQVLGTGRLPEDWSADSLSDITHAALPHGWAANATALALASEFALAQGLARRRVDLPPPPGTAGQPRPPAGEPGLPEPDAWSVEECWDRFERLTSRGS